MASVVGEFNRLSNIGIIADFWNSYIISCTNPNQIVATPHDKSYIRNPKFSEEVFKKKNYFLSKICG